MIKLTQLFIVVIVLLAAGFDFYAIAQGGTEASISHVIFVWSYKYPAFTLAAGILIGHLFWRTRDTEETKKISDSTRS